MNLSVQRQRLKQLAMMWGSIFALLAALRLPAGEAFCNCFTPMSNMLKMGKHGASSIYGPQVGHPGERATWYPQNQQQYTAYQQMILGQQSPMKRFNLFQPKWRAGSLFGSKKWMMDPSWRLMGANSNFYRPSYNYNWSPAGGLPHVTNPPQAQLLAPSGGGSYQYGDGSHQYTSTGEFYGGNSNANNIYSPQLISNDGWSALPSSNSQLSPFNSQQQQQTQLSNYGDSYGISPPSSANLVQPTKQPQSNYYGTKGASGTGSKQQQQQQYTTRK